MPDNIITINPKHLYLKMEEQYDNMRLLIEKYLKNDASPYEISYIESWIKHDERLNSWYASCLENSDFDIPADVREMLTSHLNELYNTPPDDSRQMAFLHKTDANGNRRFRIHILSILCAACVLILITMGGIYLINGFTQNDIPENPLIIGTLAGERSRVRLPDGSSVTLNHLSEIQYHYDKEKKQRIVSLHGEAAFDVRTDPSHPFVVKCDGLDIECRGTSFNVKGYPDENVVTVVLCNGLITARSLHQSLDMKPGDKVCFDKHLCNLETTSVDSSDYTDWTSGLSRFNDDRLDDILRMLSRHYGVSINLLTPSLRDVRLSGSIGKKNLNETLDLISAATGAEYVFETDTTVCVYRQNDSAH